MSVLTETRHLARRFFEVLRARPLSPAEQSEVARLLRAPETPLFWTMAVPDQRHSLECARIVLTDLPERRDLARAALLHDVGKRHSSLGIVGRTIASGLRLLRLPTPRRFDRYLDHGRLGAADLESAACEPIVVAFARHHHAPAPPQVDPGDWRVLIRADGS